MGEMMSNMKRKRPIFINLNDLSTRIVAFSTAAIIFITGIGVGIGIGRSNKKETKNDKEPNTLQSETKKNVCNISYTIKQGDTLYEIAKRFNVSVYDIVKCIDVDNLFVCPGDIVMICGVSEEITNHYYKELEETIDVEYQVVENDTLEKIAQMFGITVEEIIKANNITDENIIYKDTVLKIPNVSKSIVDKINSENKDAPVTDNNSNKNNGLPDGYIRGIDISEINGKIDWDVLERHYINGEFSFVILRMAENYNAYSNTREFTLDNQFEKNLSECNKRGIPYGAYIFSRGSNVKEINTETDSTINYINNNLNRTKVVNGEELDLTFNLSLPLYMDCFERDASAQYSVYARGDYDMCETLIKTWCDAIEDAGYFTGVYCNGSFYNDMGIDRLEEYSLWIANYGSAAITGNVGEIGLNNRVTFGPIIKNQQVTERGILDGIPGYFDVNVLDEDLLYTISAFYSGKPHILGRNINSN